MGDSFFHQRYPYSTPRIVPVDGEPEPSNAFVRIAAALERIADRFDADAKAFKEMVDSGKNLSAG